MNEVNPRNAVFPYYFTGYRFSPPKGEGKNPLTTFVFEKPTHGKCWDRNHFRQEPW